MPCRVTVPDEKGIGGRRCAEWTPSSEWGLSLATRAYCSLEGGLERIDGIPEGVGSGDGDSIGLRSKPLETGYIPCARARCC
eukprot:scaffold19425_cov129-Isochrysis_galbana.AAC.5